MAPETKRSLSARISSAQRGLARILDSFWAYVLSLSSRLRAPFQEVNKRVHPQHNTDKERANGKDKNPESIPLESDSPPPPPDKKKSYKDSEHRLKVATFVVELVGLLGLVTYAIITYFMYCETQKAADAAKSAAEAAQRQVRDSEAAQSARLVFEDLVVDFAADPPRAGYTVSNRGNSVALEINVQTGGGNGAPDQAHNWRPNFDSIRDTINGINIEPNPRGFSFPVGVGQVFSFTIPSQADISNRRASAYQYAIYVYRDIFGQKHMVSDCFYINFKTMRLEHCPLGQHSE